MLQISVIFDDLLVLSVHIWAGKGIPDMMSVIEHFETAFDWAEAEKSGRIIPHEGVDDDFDAASGIVIEVEEQLAAYLEKQRKHFGNSSEVLEWLCPLIIILDSYFVQ